MKIFLNQSRVSVIQCYVQNCLYKHCNLFRTIYKLPWALKQLIDFNQKTIKPTYDESIYKYHDICRFSGVTAVYGIDVKYGMLGVRPCAMLDMRLKQDSNEPVWKHRWTTSYCTFYMSHSLYNTTIHVNNTEQSTIQIQ